MAGGEGAGDPAHLPAEGLVEFAGVGQVTVGEEDDDEADAEGREEDGEQAAEGAFLRGCSSGGSLSRHISVSADQVVILYWNTGGQARMTARRTGFLL